MLCFINVYYSFFSVCVYLCYLSLQSSCTVIWAKLPEIKKKKKMMMIIIIILPLGVRLCKQALRIHVALDIYGHTQTIDCTGGNDTSSQYCCSHQKVSEWILRLRKTENWTKPPKIDGFVRFV